jgi:cold-shock protein, DNA-binding
MIKNLDGGSIYFYIKQVKDLELQRILATEANYKRKVKYTRGINFKGEIAADSIEMYDVEESAISEIEYQYEGYFDDYDVYENRGRIRAGNKLFNFVFEAIKDPLLYAEIMSRPYSVLELSIKFNARDHKSKKTKKASKIAYDICGIKEYSQQEIEDFVSQKYITRAEVNDWLGVVPEKNNGYFSAVDYEPLRPIGFTVQDDIATRKTVVLPASNATKYIESRSGEKKAVAILLDDNVANPFSDLKRDVSGKKYFQEAHRYMVGRKNSNGEIIGVDLEKAEELFIQSIKAMDQTSSSVANLVNIYIKQGGTYIVKGLQLLEEYGYLFPAEKLTNLRIQLIDKSGNVEALEQILMSAIPNCVKKNTVWQYMVKLAGLYYKQQRWDEAIQWFEESLLYLDQYKSLFSQYQLLRNNNLRQLIIAKYTAGNKEEAIIQAKMFLKGAPEDLVIKSIVEGTFGIGETQTILEDIDDIELQYEDGLFDISDSEMSLYLNNQLKLVDLSSTFSKVPIVYERLQNGRYGGNADDSNKAVKYINDNILKKRLRGISTEGRSSIFIGIARIISDSRENSSALNEDKVAADEVKRYVARYARYTADALVEKFATVDSVRFLYIQALKYLVAGDDGNINASLNMLIASFFMDSTKLLDELHEVGNSGYKADYYKMNCVSTKDLLIATFMLQDRQDYVTSILRSVYGEPELRLKVLNTLNKMLSSDKNITEYYDFDSIWKKVKGVYFSNLEQLGKEVSDSINEYHMAESIRTHIQRIEEILKARLLWNQDELIIDNYLKLISLIGDTLEKYTVEEKIEGFRIAEAEIAKLKSDIEASPTEFSYDYVYSKLDDLSFSIRERYDDLYQSSRPECTIFLSNNSVYVNEQNAEIAITFKNSEDKQDADAVEINIKGSEGASFIRCDKKFTSVRSGEEQDYLAAFLLDDKVIHEGQFEITVSMQYRYRDSVENIITTTITEILPVTITDKENYIRIENKYNRIIRGSGVDVKTPELFKGRNELIDSICASMSTSDGIMTKNRGIILWGQRRVGKNSVKDYLKEKIRSEYQDSYIIIELGSIGKCRNLRDVLITIINKTEDALMQDYEDLYEKLIENGLEFSGYLLENNDSYMPEFSRFMDRLSGKLKKISEEEKNIPLFFIDEFSYLYEWIEKGELDGKQFMRFWKSFIQDYGICSIIIAQDNIPVWKSRYENEFACMNHDNEITYLDYEGAKELIYEPCQIKNKILYTPEAVKLIYDWTKGSAYLIVIFCKHVIDYLNDNYTVKATKTIVQLVFEKEFIERKEMFESDDFEPQIQDVANVGQEGDEVNKLNAELLREVASETITSPQVRIDELIFFSKYGDQAQKIFVRLKERKIIEVERDTYVSISMPLLKFYLLREQSLLDKETLNKMIR